MSRRSTIANAEVIPYALYLLGGAGRYVDVEDVFFRCYEIAPQRLSWRPSPAELQDGRQGAAGFRRRLPPRATEDTGWVGAPDRRQKVSFGSGPASKPFRRRSDNLLAEWRGGPARGCWMNSPRTLWSRSICMASASPSPETMRPSSLLGALLDSPPDVWKERLETYRSAAERVGRSDLTGFLKTLEEDHPDWFGGSGADEDFVRRRHVRRCPVHRARAFDAERPRRHGRRTLFAASLSSSTNSDDADAARRARPRLGKIAIVVDRSRGQDWTAIARGSRHRYVRYGVLVRAYSPSWRGAGTPGFEAGEGHPVAATSAEAPQGRRSLRRTWLSRALRRADTPGSSYIGTGKRHTLEEEQKGSPDEDRSSLGIQRGAGTVVAVKVKAGTRCPQHQTLKRKLASHYQLRDILSDPRRRVELYTVNSGARDLLTYQYPDLPTVFDDDLTVEGYPEARAHLTVWRHHDRFDEGPDDPTRPIGVLLKGRRAIYDNTLFGLEGNPNAGWFAGKLTCEYVDVLARDFDNRRDAEFGCRPPQPPPHHLATT